MHAHKQAWHTEDRISHGDVISSLIGSYERCYDALLSNESSYRPCLCTVGSCVVSILHLTLQIRHTVAHELRPWEVCALDFCLLKRVNLTRLKQ